MNIVIKQVDCTNEEFLDYYLREDNLVLHRELYPINGFPAGFIAVDIETNQVIGSAMLIDEQMHNQLVSYDQKDNDTNPWMLALSVSKCHRNKGIGKQLVDSMIEHCNH